MHSGFLSNTCVEWKPYVHCCREVSECPPQLSSWFALYFWCLSAAEMLFMPCSPRLIQPWFRMELILVSPCFSHHISRKDNRKLVSDTKSDDCMSTCELKQYTCAQYVSLCVWLRVCVCVCKREKKGGGEWVERWSKYKCVRVWVRLRERERETERVCVLSVCVYIYIYICVCLCVCEYFNVLSSQHVWLFHLDFPHSAAVRLSGAKLIKWSVFVLYPAHQLSQVTSLPGWSGKSYSGFITVNATHQSNMFFWFFPAQVHLKLQACLWCDEIYTQPCMHTCRNICSWISTSHQVSGNTHTQYIYIYILPSH